MTVIFALFFLLLGFIGGILFACGCTLDMLKGSAKSKTPLLGKYRITLVEGEPEQD